MNKLGNGYRQDAPWAVAAIARLRREAGKEVHVSPTAWGLEHLEKLAELREEQREEEAAASGTGRASRAYLSSWEYAARDVREQQEDTAVHLAVTLWALHQQSVRDDDMHQRGWTLGRAVRRLAEGRTGARDAPARGGAAADGESDSKADGAGSGPQAAGPAAETTAADADINEAVRRRFVRVGSASDAEVLATRLRELVLLLRAARIPLDYALLADHLLLWQGEERRDTVRRSWGRDFHRRYRSADKASGDGADDSPGSPNDLDDEPLDPEESDGDA
ncbi:type I-E CRISPR-associated protein Cse2/CasB [Streptomyces sp. NPDC046203]|uniref:type I-E CRISPR-associated protein Cse2/CasB n=1 Tax=Streptomyces sp. NPDC046203 TaxID=3154602 RepID=UPI0033C133FE